MKTLKLTLKKVWFDMILSGQKAEEYLVENAEVLSIKELIDARGLVCHSLRRDDVRELVRKKLGI